MGSPHVRPLAQGDYEAWRQLWRGYLEFYQSSIPDEVTETTFSRLLDPAEPMAGAVAVVDGSLVGLVHTIQHRATWARGHYCYLEDLFVAREARGCGAGRALIDYVYAWAEELGCQSVYWLTHETNATARRLYDQVADRSGFIHYSKAIGSR